MCRSTPGCPMPASSSSLDAAPIAAITTAELAGRLDGHDLLVIDVDDPAVGSPGRHRVSGAEPPTIRLPDVHVGHHRGAQRGGHHPLNLTRLLESRITGLHLPPGQVWSQCHSLAFDFSVRESAVHFWVAGGWWWCPSRWPAHWMTSTPC